MCLQLVLLDSFSLYYIFLHHNFLFVDTKFIEKLLALIAQWNDQRTPSAEGLGFQAQFEYGYLMYILNNVVQLTMIISGIKSAIVHIDFAQ